MSSANSRWAQIDSKLKHGAPVVLLLLVVYLYSSLVAPILSTQALQYVEIAIITYYLSELVIKYVIADNYKQFLRDYWLDIVLLVPFFSTLKLLGAVGKTLKSIKGLKAIKHVQKAIKVPKIMQKMLFSSDKSGKKTNDKKD